MRSLFRRFLLVLCALRYGARLLWRAAPEHHKLHWFVTLLSGMHEAGSAPPGLAAALPRLAPVAGAFAQALAAHPELAQSTLHDALDAVAHLEEPLPPAAAEAALHTAFGRPLADLFTSIDLTPVHTGFCEQTHIAQLAVPVNGHRTVAIKLLRAHEVEQVGDEAALLRGAAHWMERFFPAARRLDAQALADAFTQDIQRRFDLREQAASLSQTGRQFEGDTRLVVPDVIWELCTARTLVVQHVEAVPALDIATLHAHHVNVAEVAVHLIEVVTQQAFEHGFFHAALDARRVRVSVEPESRGRLVLAEFAVMSSLSSPERDFFVHGATALFEQDYGRLAQIHQAAGHVPAATRTEQLEAELRTRSEAHFAAAPEDRSAGAAFHHLLHAVQPFDGAVPARLVTAQRAFSQAETLARTLHPEIDSWNVARGVLADIARRDLGHRGWITRLSRELPHLAHMVPRMPQLLVRYLEHEHRADRHDARLRLAAEIRREHRRTRALLWACALCGGVLGASAIVLTVVR
ncbi:ABC1 kinase family protein [Paraburkholderia kururiensis]|uniref:AarF/UbiB family protein n=1 Tax=Paraburkholderia kururiensis TaxID=984307 RepID=A0ABZ0WKI6_9BURK|nr:AarF/UbiB family protein [Paraburkholderia kururiensis]WQD77870.1 AarF/UbiB family protein [Paraburkholderia kururiensis]